MKIHISQTENKSDYYPNTPYVLTSASCSSHFAQITHESPFFSSFRLCGLCQQSLSQKLLSAERAEPLYSQLECSLLKLSAVRSISNSRNLHTISLKSTEEILGLVSHAAVWSSFKLSQSLIKSFYYSLLQSWVLQFHFFLSLYMI